MYILEESLLITLSPLSEFWDKKKEFEKEEENQRKELLEKPWGEEQYTKNIEYHVWFQEKNIELLECFGNEVKELEQKQKYFFGCSFKIYRKHYEERLRRFLKKYEDATEIDFIEEELQTGIFHLPYEEYEQFIFSEIEKQFHFALKKRFQFLTERSNDLGFEVIYIPQQEEIDGTICKETFSLKSTPKINTQNNISPLKWNGGQTELIELIKALILAGKVKGTQKEIIATFAEFFQIEIKNPDKLLQDIKLRSNGSETLFLDQLKKTLLDYIIK